jgi:hypothetical protein
MNYVSDIIKLHPSCVKLWEIQKIPVDLPLIHFDLVQESPLVALLDWVWKSFFHHIIKSDSDMFCGTAH